MDVTPRSPLVPEAARRAASILARRLLGVALPFALAVLPARALAGPADTDEPLVLPRLERDPRVEFVEPGASSRPLSPLRAPLWVAIDTSFVRREPGDTSFGAMLLLGLPLDRLFARDVRVAAIADRPSPAEHGDPPRADPAPALKPPPRMRPLPPEPQAR